MNEIWGVGGVAVTEAGSILVFPPNPENTGKLEKVVGTDGSMEDIGPMSEGLGGAVDEGDWVGLNDVLKYALMREALEERKLNLSINQIQLLPEGMEVEQKRESKNVNFLVACFVIRLNGDQEYQLRQNGALDLQLGRDLRPRDKGVINIYNRAVEIPVNLPVEELA
jgi:hypothetical protein